MTIYKNIPTFQYSHASIKFFHSIIPKPQCPSSHFYIIPKSLLSDLIAALPTIIPSQSVESIILIVWAYLCSLQADNCIMQAILILFSYISFYCSIVTKRIGRIMGNNIIQLDKMTIEEKIRIMEAIWDDLSKRAENIHSPSWHEEILTERESRIEKENEKFIEWERAKKQIQNNIKCK